MILRSLLAVSAALFFLFGCQPAELPDRNQRVSVHASWSVFHKTDYNPELCWVASTPLSGNAALKKTYLLYNLSKREISVVFEGGEGTGTVGTMTVSGNEFGMFFRGQQGWMNSARLDRLAIDAIRNASTLSVETAEISVSFVTDGFERAAIDAGKRCNISAF